MPKNPLILITGGSRSGKSRLAVLLAKRFGRRVTYIATCRPGDAEMRARVRRHRQERPHHWRTIEDTAHLERHMQHLDGTTDAVILDCLTMYIADLMRRGLKERGLQQRMARLCAVMRQAACPVIVVTNEVGSSVVPEHRLGRQFRDMAGIANQLVARSADQVFLMVAGIPVQIKGAAHQESYAAR